MLPNCQQPRHVDRQFPVRDLGLLGSWSDWGMAWTLTKRQKVISLGSDMLEHLGAWKVAPSILLAGLRVPETLSFLSKAPKQSYWRIPCPRNSIQALAGVHSIMSPVDKIRKHLGASSQSAGCQKGQLNPDCIVQEPPRRQSHKV